MNDRGRGSLTGLFIGDALAMPAHWYYQRAALRRDYGRIDDYQAPRNPHPDSILWRSHYTPLNRRGEILHDQAAYWGRHSVHYHQFLAPGENTLNLKLCRLLVASLNERGRYDADDFLGRYVDFMTTPGRHRDTYVEECHRHFFTAYARSTPLRRCAADEFHVGGLVGSVPLLVHYREEPEAARAVAREHVALTHAGPAMEGATTLFADILLEVLAGSGLEVALEARIERRDSPLLAHPFRRWRGQPDEAVIGSLLSPACYLEDAIPATLFLALKYHDDPEAALVANTHLGGDNCHRGALLGALLGAEHGPEGFPERWRTGLHEAVPTLPGHEDVRRRPA
jgi:ADP-ribosylglycohydrolase